MSRKKTKFCPVPPRAMSDPLLSGVDLRVLCAIAKRGGLLGDRACWAGHRKLQEDTGVHYTNISKSVKKLERSFYLRKERNTQKGRGRGFVYYIIYDEDFPKFGLSDDQQKKLASNQQRLGNPAKLLDILLGGKNY